MFYGHNYDILSMMVYWIAVSLAFGISFHLALKITRIELKRNEMLYIIAVSMPFMLVPAVGPCLAFFSTVVLTYRITDTSPGKAASALTLTWLFAIIALLAAIGLSRVLVVL